MDNDELRAATGEVDDTRPVVGLLYDLMRDHLPVGDVERLVRDSEAIGPANVCLFTNGLLANYARLLADRLGVHVGVEGAEKDARFDTRNEAGPLGPDGRPPAASIWPIGRLVRVAGENPRSSVLLAETDSLPDDSCLDLVEL